MFLRRFEKNRNIERIIKRYREISFHNTSIKLIIIQNHQLLSFKLLLFERKFFAGSSVIWHESRGVKTTNPVSSNLYMKFSKH